MGRRRPATDEDQTTVKSKLAPPFLGIKDPIGLWFHHENELISMHKFGALYSAKKFIESVIGEWDTSWKDERTLAIRKGWITITSQQGPTLEDIMEHSYTPAELTWALPIPYPGYVNMIRGYHWGTHPDVASDRNGPRPTPETRTRERDGSISPPGVSSSSEKRREKREKQSKREPRPDGLVTIADVAAQVGIDPREARQILRASTLKKPEHGWAWPADEVTAVKHVLNTGKKKR